ncbi:hypothetical protein BB559_005844 [Furculomyces boomerangus]|uniref:Cytochrome b5 heme-binding domain-containing protein n=1 Tax=Furculomyces boomerangus TaxID=61424 RepID=A0A2T9Y6G2_9FUNG|nr:hypothetical protein BB559_005844 [Furculomyces boomerangus]
MTTNNLYKRQNSPAHKQSPRDSPAHKLPPEKQATPIGSPKNSPRFVLNFVFKTIFSLILFNLAISYLLTESFFWGYQSKYTNWRNYIPKKALIFSPEQLAKYDGSNPNLPIYVAIKGDVYDVTLGKHWYGKGSSYNLFAGKDSSRAFATNCLSRKDHLTNDIRDLTKTELANLDGWISFFKNHQKYTKIGTVIHNPIDPNSPPPPKCVDAHPKPNNKNPH